MTTGLFGTIAYTQTAATLFANDLHVDDDNIYVIGYSTGGAKATVLQIDKTALTLTAGRDYFNGGQDILVDIVGDLSNVYAVGYTSEGSGDKSALILKYDKSDMSLDAKEIISSAGTDEFNSVCEYGDYVYAVGITPEGAGTNSGLVVKYNKSDLSVNTKKYIEIPGGATTVYIYGAAVDSTDLYLVGTYTTGGTDYIVVIKLNTSDLSMDASFYITATADAIGIDIDDDYVYTVGFDATAGIIAKWKKSDLSVVASARLGTSVGTTFNDIAAGGSHVYVTGSTDEEGNTAESGLIAAYKKSDLTLTRAQYFDDNDTNQYIGHGITFNAGKPYIIAVSSGGNVGTIIALNAQLITTGDGNDLSFYDSALTETALSLASTTVSFTSNNSALSASTSALTDAATAHTLTSIEYVPSAGTIYTYDTTDRILGVIQTETPFEDKAEIILDNTDQVISGINFRGERIQLGFGFGSAYSNVPDLYVARQEDVSVFGRLYTRLACIGNWGKLGMHKVMGDSTTGALTTGTDTVKEIIEARILMGMELVVDTSDGEEDSKVPNSQYEVYTERRQIIQENVGLTQNLLFMRDSDIHMINKNNSQQHRITGTIGGTFTKGELLTQASSGATGKFVYQSAASGSGYIVIEAETGTFNNTNTITGGSSAVQLTSPTANDAFDYLYGPLAGTHTFRAFARTQSLLAANRVLAVDTLPDISGTTHSWPDNDTAGIANDTEDQAVFGLVTLIFEDPSISSNAEATTAATSRLEHIKVEAVGGVLLAPMNCGQEMYDYVQIDDDRLGLTGGSKSSQRVSGIIRRFSPGEYTIELKFGGLVWDTPENYDLSQIATDTSDIDKAIKATRGPEGVIPQDKKPRMPNEEERLAQVAADSARVIADMSREQQQQFLKDVKAGMEALGISTEGVGKPPPTIQERLAQPIDKTVAEIGKGLADMTPEQKKKFMENIRRQLNEEN